MIGTWHVNAEKSSGAANVRRIEIKPDATCIRYESAEDDPNPRTFYDHIRLIDGGLVVSGYWGKQTFALALEGDTMTWTEGDTRFVFHRATKTPPPAADSIIGLWKSADGIMEFNADGTGRSTKRGPDGDIVGSERFVYRIEGDTILCKGPDPDFDKWQPVQWRIEDDTLYLTDDGKVHKLTRVEESPAENWIVAREPLEFHVLPGTDGDLPGLTEKAIKKYRTQLEEEGSIPGKARGDSYQWARVDKDFRIIPNCIQGQYMGETYVLLSAKPEESLCAHGAEVSPGVDEMGRPCINFRLDPKGSDLFYAFTKNNIHKSLAILINGTVYSAPMVASAVAGRGMLAGQFSKEKVEQLIVALGAGMPAPDADAAALPGTWKSVALTGRVADRYSSITMTFAEDGTGKGVSVYLDGRQTENVFTYKRQADKLYIGTGEPNDEPEEYQCSIEKDKLRLQDAKGTMEFVRKPVSGGPEPSADNTTADIVGTWRADKAVEDGVEKDLTTQLELKDDGTYTFDAVSAKDGHAEGAGRYTVKGNIVTFQGDLSIPAGIFKDDALTLTGQGRTIVLKKYAPSIASVVGTWESVSITGTDDRTSATLTFNADGTYTAIGIRRDGTEDANVGEYTFKNGRVYIEGAPPDDLITVAGDRLTYTSGDVTAVFKKLDPKAVDQRFVGDWKSRQFSGSVDKKITSLYLTLNADLTFVLAGEGADMGKPIRGLWRTDGDILTLRGQTQPDRDALAFIKSARYDNGSIRLAIGAGAAVLERVTANPFAGAEHPMFRAELTSAQGPNGQTWLDLDTGRIITAEEFSAAEDKDDYELTIGVGQLIRQWPAKMLPIHNVGMEFARAAAAAIKYLPSLEQSRLTCCDYKGGAFVAVCTDRGNLAVVQMMTPTADDQTPVAWSLASITETADGPPRIEAIGLAATGRAGEYVVQPGDTLHGICIKIFGPVEGVRQETHEALMALNGLASANQLRVGQVLNIPTAAPARSVTLPDLDEQPAFVDLATGDMVVMPEGIEKDDEALRTHLTQLAKGDLGFDKQLVVLRGGSACLWDGVNSTAMASTVHEPFNIRAYDLANFPCRLLVMTGDGKQFDVSVLKKTPDGGLEIEYTPVGTKVTTPAADSAAVIHAVDRDHAAQLIAQLKLVRMAMDRYQLDEGKRPDLSTGWTTLTEKAGTGPYLKAAPVNPFTGGSKIAADASGDWQFDPAAGTLKAVVPFTLERARQLGLDTENDVVCAAGGEVAMSNLAEMCPPIGASERVRYALDKIASLMRYVESQKDGDIAALSGYFDQINEFCDDLQGKNGPAPGGEEWGVMAADQIEAVIKLLGEIEQTAEGCRELSRGGYKELLDQHWQSLKYEYSRLCTALQTAARTQLQSGAEPAGTHDHFVGWYRLSKDIVFPVLKIDGMFYAPCRGMEIPFKKTAEGLEWALTPSSMAGTTIGRLPGMNQYYLRNMDRQTIEQLEASNQPNPLGYGKNQPITRIETPKGLLEMTASIPRRLDDFVGWYQPTWFPAFRFHLRKDMDQYIWQEQRMGSRLGEWASAAKEIELTPLTDDTGFGLGNERLTYNKSLKRYEIVKTGSQLLRMPLSRVPEPTPETDAKAPWPPAVTGIPAWN